MKQPTAQWCSGSFAAARLSSNPARREAKREKDKSLCLPRIYPKHSLTLLGDGECTSGSGAHTVAEADGRLGPMRWHALGAFSCRLYGHLIGQWAGSEVIRVVGRQHGT